MFTELNDLLEGRVEPGRLAGYHNLSDALDRHNCTLWKDQILQILMTGDERDSTTLPDDVHAMIFNQVEALLAQMHLVLDFQAMPLTMLADVLRVLAPEPADDDPRILEILNGVEYDDDALVEFLAARTPYEPEELLPYVVSVSHGFITTLKSVIERYAQYQQQPSSMQTLLRQQELALGRLNQFRAVVPEATAPSDALDAQIPLGTSMESLVKLYQPHLVEVSVEQAVDDLLGLALYANTGLEALSDEVSFFIEQYYPSVMEAQKATRQLNRRMTQLKGILQS